MPTGTIVITGTITNNGVPVPGVYVRSYEQKITVESGVLKTHYYLLAGSAATDIYGSYSLTINEGDIINTDYPNGAILKVIVMEGISDDPNTTAGIAYSEDLANWTEQMTVDLKIPAGITYTNVSPRFDNSVAAIKTVVGSDDSLISKLTIDESKNRDDVRFVSNAAKIDPVHVQTAIKAYNDKDAAAPHVIKSLMSGDTVTTAVSADIFFALTQATSSSRNALTGQPLQAIKDMITNAASNNVIKAPPTTYLDPVKVFQKSQANAITIAGEPAAHTLGVVLSAAMGAGNVDKFLTTLNQETPYSNVDAFWAALPAESWVADAKLGVQMAGLNGFQPAMITAMKSAMATAGVTGMEFFATIDDSAWDEIITAGKTAQAGVPPIPYPILNGSTEAAARTAYIKILKTTAQNIYPHANISKQLKGSTGDILIPDTTKKGHVTTFLDLNPDFDLRTNSVQDIVKDMPGVPSDEIAADLQDLLAPFQRILRLTKGAPETVTAMLLNGHSSSLAITQLGLAKFTSLYGSNFTTEEIASIFTAAVTTHLYSTHTLLNARQDVRLANNSVILNFGAQTDATTDSDFVKLFGSNNYCSCDQCTSLYSPAAYLADLLNFMSKHADDDNLEPSTNFSYAYNELLRKRPDIANIDLSCKNTNTLMPYIDLVIEVLETAILKKLSFITDVPGSYQTTATADELAAYPEHTYRTVDDHGKQVYLDYTNYAIVYQDVSTHTGVLNNAVYPFNLPFSLPLEESRVYLNYLGKTRLELMKTFLPPLKKLNFFVPPDTTYITNYSIFCEWLGITMNEAAIITNTAGDPPSFWTWYGLNLPNNDDDTQNGVQDPLDSSLTILGQWYIVLLTRLDVFLKQTEISYPELLAFMDMPFINPKVPPAGVIDSVSIVSVDGAPIDTCRLDQLQFAFYDGAARATFIVNFGRFLRLYKTGKLSIRQWDMLMNHVKSFGFFQSDFMIMGQALMLADKLRIPAEVLVSYWSDLDITSYTDYDSDTLEKFPTVYDTIYNNKSVINNPSENPLYNPGHYTGSYGDHATKIAGFCGVSENDFVLLGQAALGGDFLSHAVTLTGLSRIYFITQLAKNLGYSATDMNKAMILTGFTIPATNAPDRGTIQAELINLSAFSDAASAIASSGFTVSELYFLSTDLDPDNIYKPSPENIKIFLEGLRSELQKQDYYDPSVSGDSVLLTRLSSVVYQHFSKEFSIPSQWVEIMLNPSGAYHSYADVITKFINGTLVNLWFTNTAGVVLSGPNYDLSEQTITYLDSKNPLNGHDNQITDTGQFNGVCLPTFLLKDLYDCYRRIYKIVYIVNKLGIKDIEFQYFYRNPSASGIGSTGAIINLSALPIVTGGDPAPTFNAILRLSRWIQVRNRLSLTAQSLCSLIDISYTILPTALPATIPNTPLNPDDASATDPTKTNYFNNLDTCVSIWISIVNQSSWGTMLSDLIGKVVTRTQRTTVWAPAGLLNLVFSARFNSLQTADLDYSDFAPNSYDKISNILRIADIIDWCVKTGLTPVKIASTLTNNVDLIDSRNIMLAAKGTQTDADWAKIAKPLRDPIRQQQRDALVGYMLANSNRKTQYAWQKPDDLYAYYLIDVQTEPAVMTSRLKQAVSSVQIYVDRLMMNLEYKEGKKFNIDVDPKTSIAPIHISQNFIDQWHQWRQWYAVWGSNREVFIYPENWLDPEFRDDKTPFFKEFETELLQEDVNDSNVQDAFLNYLDKVQEVSQMEPVGTCEEYDESGQKVIHVISRTHSDPHHYYYRKLVADIWSPWEQINVNISSEHVVPVVWEGRLYLYWLTFKQKRAKFNKSVVADLPGTDFLGWFLNYTSTVNVEGVSADDNSQPTMYYNQLEVTLNWARYTNGAWSKQKSAKEKMLLNLNPYLEPNPIFFANGVINAIISDTNNSSRKKFYARISNNLTLTVPKIAETRIHIQPFIAGGGKNFIHGDTSDDGDLYMMLYFTINPNDTSEHAQYLHSFRISDSNAEPEVVKQGYYKNNIAAPANTLFFNMKFIACNVLDTSEDSVPLKIDKYNLSATIWPNDTLCWYDYLSQEYVSIGKLIKLRANSTPILNQMPNGYFKLTVQSGFSDNPLEGSFVFEDDVNTFFVRRKYNDTQTQKAYSVASASSQSYNLYNVQPGTTAPVAPTQMALEDYVSMFSSLPIEIPHYYFQTFYHPQINDFITAINRGGLDSLMTLKMQASADKIDFNAKYSPADLTYKTLLPVGTVDFDHTGAYSIYNWEIFFHAPFMIAQRLSTNQQFEQAQKWFHYIFDPTSNTDINGAASTSKNRFWKFKPFYDLATQDIQSIAQLLEQVSQNNEAAKTQIITWQQDPFAPFAIARLRIQAFMKSVAMAYVDNLVAWADQLFTQNTTESINQATQLYILASNMLGDRPKELKSRLTPVVSSFQDLINSGTLDDFSNAQVKVENYINPMPTRSKIMVANTMANLGFTNKGVLPTGVKTNANGTLSLTSATRPATAAVATKASILTSTPLAQTVATAKQQIGTLSQTLNKQALITKAAAPGVVVKNAPQLSRPTKALGFSGIPIPTGPVMFYFCLPPNDHLLSYWDTVGDRLFKIRNSMNIAGQVQQLPLFDPIIDPALLIRAKAAGISISSVMNDVSNANLPIYRFSYMLQKANELCGDVKALGSAMLAALEKKDAEDFALLRSGLEYTVLQSMLLIKQSQLDEANTNLTALNNNRDIVQARYDYYSGRPYMNDKEQQYFNSIKAAMVLQVAQGELGSLAASGAAEPQFHAQGPFAIGAAIGGVQISSVFRFVSEQMGILAAINTAQGQMASTTGGFDRRQDDWKFQADAAQKELIQLDTQLIAAQLRVDIAQQEYDNQQTLIDNNRSEYDFMSNKFTSSDMYNWMITQLSVTYFQAYQMATQFAKKAGLCYDFELPYATTKSTQLLKFGYWDSLKKGLLAGEQLQYDLRNLESSYIAANKRTFELTKNVSLAFFDPTQLVHLKATGSCTISLPEELFDIEYPNHYYRIIKSVSISIPCVAGPYTTIPCTLTATGDSFRRSSTSSTAILEPIHSVPVQSIATSHAQNDNGMFEFNFRDERYLPFEGMGVVSTWNIQLGGLNLTPSSIVNIITPFDIGTINDVILHVKYTALEGGSTFGGARTELLNSNIKIGLWKSNVPLLRCFSLKHEFSNAWYKFVQDVTNGVSNPKLSLDLYNYMFPSFCAGKGMQMLTCYMQMKLKTGVKSATLTFTNSLGINQTLTNSAMGIPSSVAIQLDSITPTNISFAIKNAGVDANLDSLLDDVYMIFQYKIYYNS